MHTHQSLWNGDTPLFYDADGYALLSDTARWYIGGLLAHAPAVLAFAAPTTNSYRRLVPGYEAPIKLAARDAGRCDEREAGGAPPGSRLLAAMATRPMGMPPSNNRLRKILGVEVIA